MPYFTEKWANPSSLYRTAADVSRAIQDSRDAISNSLNGTGEGVIFTSGATESINSAIHSATLRFPRKKHILTSSVEHSATLAYCDFLERFHGYEVTRLSVDSVGNIDLRELEGAIRPETALVTLIWANNETGVIWPMEEVAVICRDKCVMLHVDAVQAVGKIPVDFRALGADFVSFSGHKIGCPKGIGGLLLAEPEKFHPLLYGGKQEFGLRGGTENTAQIVGLAKAMEISRSKEALDQWNAISALREQFEARIRTDLYGAAIHGGSSKRLPNTTSVYLPGIDADAAVTYLDQKGICVSSGSACMESAIAPSHVIYAMTGSHDVASETLRISLGRNSTKDELDLLLSELVNLTEIYS